MTETSGSSPPPTAAEVAAVAEAIAAAQALAAAGDAPSTSGGSGAAAAAAEDVRVGEERKDDCGPKFDALWCCYCECCCGLPSSRAPPLPPLPVGCDLMANVPATLFLPSVAPLLAAPRFQLAQYYIYGRVDNCHARWGELMDCLKKKTSVYKEEVGPGVAGLLLREVGWQHLAFQPGGACRPSSWVWFVPCGKSGRQPAAAGGGALHGGRRAQAAACGAGACAAAQPAAERLLPRSCALRSPGGGG